MKQIIKYLCNLKLISSHFKDSTIEISISIFNYELTFNDSKKNVKFHFSYFSGFSLNLMI